VFHFDRLKTKLRMALLRSSPNRKKQIKRTELLLLMKLFQPPPILMKLVPKILVSQAVPFPVTTKT
jgi:hypothetical protein